MNHTTAPPLGFATRISYGAGQIAEGLKNTALSTFLLFYYNQVLGLPGTLTGLALFIALVFDAITDPLAGSLSDNHASPRGRRHPFMYASAVPLAIAFVALFAPPVDLLGEWGLFVWLTCSAVLTRGAMTLYHVPHVALGAELSDDYEERTEIVSFRLFFSTFGALLAIVLGFGVFFADDNGGQLNRDAYLPFALTLGVGMVGTILWSAYATRHRVPWLPRPPLQKVRLSIAAVLLRVLAELREALSNPSFRWLFIGVLIVFLMAGVDAALNIYMYRYFWELHSGDMLWLFMASPIGMMLGAPLTKYLHRWVDKLPGVVFGTGWWVACQVVPVILRMLDMFPENGTTTLFWMLLVIKFLQGMGVVQAHVSFNSMMADVADAHEVRTHRRQEGIFFGAVSFSAKATSGLGNFFAGVGLDLIAWPRGADIRTAADVPPETLTHLGLLYGPIVAGTAVFALWCYSQYDLDRHSYARIRAELDARRAASAAAEAT